MEIPQRTTILGAAKLTGKSSKGLSVALLGPIHRFQRPDATYLEVDSAREQLGGHGGLIQVGKKGGKINFNLLGQYRSPGLNLNDIGYIRRADFVGERGEVSYRMNEPGLWVRNYSLALQ